MEIVCAIGMLMAFLLGAWVRKPFYCMLGKSKRRGSRKQEEGYKNECGFSRKIF